MILFFSPTEMTIEFQLSSYSQCFKSGFIEVRVKHDLCFSQQVECLAAAFLRSIKKPFYRSPFKKTNRALNCCLVPIQTAVYYELLFLWPAMTN